MARGVPVNPETREKILALHRDGVSRNEIARQLGVSTGVVSRIVAAAGGSFVRAAETGAAKVARVADLTALRDRLVIGMAAVGEQELKRAREPYVVWSFGGVDNSYNEHTLELPPAAEVRSMQTTAAVAVDKLQKAIEASAVNGASEAESVLSRLEQDMAAEFDSADDAEFRVAP